MKTDVLIDWMSWTVPCRKADRDMSLTEIQLQWFDDMVDFLSGIPEFMSLLIDPTPARGRAPYNQSYQYKPGIVIFANPKLDTLLFEVSGMGCELLRKHDLLTGMLFTVAERLTRFDLAIDVLTDIKPSEIANTGLSKRFKSTSTVVSTTGETVYFGSRTSDRYLRIYRYNAPHPRHGLLRYEFVFRKAQARSIVAQWESEGFSLEKLMAYCGGVFGIQHETFQADAEPLEVGLTRKERTHASTLLWLTGTVAPAFKKLVADGIIVDREQFIKEHFYE